MKEEPSSGNLNPSEYKSFWISWEAGSYKVGRGQSVGEDLILEWDDDQGKI